MSSLLVSLAPWQEEANGVFSLGPAGSPPSPAHWALEAVVVVEAAPLAEATVNREFCMDSADVELA